MLIVIILCIVALGMVGVGSIGQTRPEGLATHKPATAQPSSTGGAGDVIRAVRAEKGSPLPAGGGALRPPPDPKAPPTLYRWQIDSGSTYGGLTTNWSEACGVATYSVPRLTVMTSAPFSCLNSILLAPSSPDPTSLRLTLISPTPFPGDTLVGGVGSSAVVNYSTDADPFALGSVRLGYLPPGELGDGDGPSASVVLFEGVSSIFLSGHGPRTLNLASIVGIVPAGSYLVAQLDFDIPPSCNFYLVLGTDGTYESVRVALVETEACTPSPAVFHMTGGGSYCEGEAGVTVGVDGSENGVAYQLKVDGTEVGSPVAGDGTALDFGLQTTAGTYSVDATNATPCTREMLGYAVVTANPIPMAPEVSAGGPTTLCLGDSVTLTSSSAEGDNQWYWNGTAIPEAMGTTLVVTEAGDYWTVVTQMDCESPASNVTTVTVAEAHPSGGASVTEEIVCNGGTATVTVAASGGTPPYSFSLNGVTQAVGVFSGIHAGSGYPWTVADANGCTDGGALAVPEPPVLQFTTTNVDPTVEGGGADGSITFSASGGTPEYGYSIDAGAHFQASSLFEGLAAGEYGLVVRDAGGCLKNGAATLVNPAAPVITSIEDQDGCAQSGIKVYFTPGPLAVSHDLYQDGVRVVEGYGSGVRIFPPDTGLHAYTVVAVGAGRTDTSVAVPGRDLNATPPEAQGLLIEISGANLVFHWSELPDSTTVDTYEVLRSSSAMGPFDGSVGSAATGFEGVSADLAREPVTAYYRVRAVKGSCEGPLD